MEHSQKHVLLIAVQVSKTTWLRSLCVEELPKKEDIVFYYRDLCGFKDAVISVTAHAVPTEFQESLLAVESTAFPKRHVEAASDEKVAEYRAYIHQVCEAERSRIRLTVDRDEASTKEARDPTPREPKKRKTWASELLSQLNTVSTEATDAEVVAWVITAEKESRILMDSAVGAAWEPRLGSPLYPDFVVSRRITTASWGFQHPSSVSLLSATIAWYLAARGVVVTNGVSSPVAGIESDLLALTAPFAALKGVTEEKEEEEEKGEEDYVGKPRNTDLAEDRPSLSRFSKIKATPPKPIVVLLQKIEQSMLFSRMENTSVEPLSESILRRFLTYMARGHSIDAEDEIVGTTIRRWVTAQMGFSTKTRPLLTSWNPLWDTLMSAEGRRDAVTAARVDLLVRTLDAWDACESAVMTEEQRRILLEDWIAVYRDKELVADRGARVIFATLETDPLGYLDQFLPRSFAQHKRFRDTVASVFLKKGYSAAVLSGTLCLLGAKLLRAAKAAVPQKAEKAEKAAEKPEKKKESKITVVSNTVVDLGFF